MKIKNRYTNEIILEIDTLRGADLIDTILTNADLSNADLSNANLSYADFTNANLSNANFSDANFSNANLSYADFSYADLSYANLSYANFSDANFSYADLSYADFSYANFSDADLRRANLSNVNIYRTIGNMFEIKSAQVERYPLAWTSKILWIGWIPHTFDEWKSFSDEKILEMGGMNGVDDLVWWKKWKEIIFKMIEIGK